MRLPCRSVGETAVGARVTLVSGRYGGKNLMNPTGTVRAMAYHTAHGIINGYLNAPGEIILDA